MATIMSAASEISRHHQRDKICHTRPKYRDGRKERAVKVYTVSKESKYLLIQGLPAIRLEDELINMCSRFGDVENYKKVQDFPAEEFTEVYWVKYTQFQSARFAKKKIDDKSFFGGVLHVSYAPEYETVQDTREKLQERKRYVAKKLRQLADSSVTQPQSEHPSADSLQFSGNAESEQSLATGQDAGVAASKDVQYYQIGEDGQSCGPPRSESIAYTQHPGTMTSGDQSQGFVDNSTWFPELPLPPRELPPWQRRDFGRTKQTFDHARVPSANATLPPGYNPFVVQPTPERPIGPQLPPGMQRIPKLSPEQRTEEGPRKPKQDSDAAPDKISKHSADTAQKQNTTQAGKKIVIKPRFVPRQMKAVLKRKHSETEDKSESVPASDKPGMGDVSLDRTVSAIRDRMKHVSHVDCKNTQPPPAVSVSSSSSSRSSTKRKKI